MDFRKGVLTSCKNVRDMDELWFDEMLNRLVFDFKANCSEQVSSVLKEYSVSEKAELIKHANDNLQVPNPWYIHIIFVEFYAHRCPSGDPEKDIRAHLMSQNQHHVERLAKIILNLDRQLRPQLAELKARKCKVQDEYDQLQLLVRQLKEVSDTILSFSPSVLKILMFNGPRCLRQIYRNVPFSPENLRCYLLAVFR